MAVAEAYVTGKASALQLVREYGVGHATVRRWATNYLTMGVDGLIAQRKNATYSVALKMAAVDDYLSGKFSLKEIQKKYKLRSDAQIRNWVKCYNGHKEFKHPNTGGEFRMVKHRETTIDERIEIVSYCIANSKDYGKTIEKYNVSYHQLYAWVRKYEQRGADGLLDRRGKRKPKSEMSEVDKLKAQLKLKNAENLRLQMENELLKKLEALERGRVED